MKNEIWELVTTNLFSTKYIDYKLCDTFIRMEVKCSTSLRTSMDYKRAELRHFMGRINIWCEQSLSFFFLGLETLSMHNGPIDLWFWNKEKREGKIKYDAVQQIFDAMINFTPNHSSTSKNVHMIASLMLQWHHIYKQHR